MRSSAVDEDGAEHSFAGQLESLLNVPPARVWSALRAVHDSGTSERLLAYRRERGLTAPPEPTSVLVQRMVRARCAGVAFSADPVTGRRGVAVVSAVNGLGTGLVSGECDADTWHVDRAGAIVHRAIAAKRRMHVADPGAPGGVCSVGAPLDRIEQPALERRQRDRRGAAGAPLLGNLRPAAGHRVGDRRRTGSCCCSRGRSRRSPALPDPDGAASIWDNSNIAESYSGVTTPLTFSFARDGLRATSTASSAA